MAVHLGYRAGIRVPGSSTPVDPLAGFNWAARLQTHIPGNNTPLGMFQDVACTIPSTQDGDNFAGWKDVLSDSGVIFTQAVSDQIPIFVSDGSTPTGLLDGVNDFWATVLAAINDFTLFVVVNQTGDNALLGSSTNFQTRVGESGSNVLSTFDSVNNPQSSPLGVAQGNWSTLGFKRNGSSVEFFQNGISYGTGLMSGAFTPTCFGAFLGALNFLNGQVIAVLLSPESMTGPDVATVFNYTALLIP